MVLPVEIKFLHKVREFSSVGSEHLPYKQGVIGSTPITPTKRKGCQKRQPFFILPFHGHDFSRK